LYAIIDAGSLGARSVRSVAEQLVEGGVSAIQLRNKSDRIDDFFADAVQVRTVTANANVPFIVNDRLDIAVAVRADGIHVGQSDLPVPAVRRLLGPEKIVGVSVHNTREMQDCEQSLVTYWGVGTIYPTRTKEDLTATGVDVITEVRAMTAKPVVAIGGITLNNLEPVFEAGASGVAIVSDLLVSDDIAGRTRMFVDRIALLRSQTAIAN